MTSSVRLRNVTEEDLPIFFEQQLDPDANYMAAFTARDPADQDVFTAHWTRILGDDSVTLQAILFDGQVAGYVALFELFGQPSIGYWIGKEYWGKGVATQMLSMFLRLVTDRPLHAHVAKHNVASIRVLEKCGFALCAKATGALGEPADGIEELVYVTDTSSVRDSESNTPPNIYMA